jgi:hypothetical protein
MPPSNVISYRRQGGSQLQNRAGAILLFYSIQKLPSQKLNIFKTFHLTKFHGTKIRLSV